MPLRSPHVRLSPGACRRSRTWRRGALITVAIAAVALGATGGPDAATADPTTPGSATSKAAEAVAGAGITIAPNAVTLLPGSALSPALNLLGLSNANGLQNSLVAGIVTPLTTALTQLPSRTLTSLATSIAGAGLRADNPSTQQPRPTDGSFPTCGQQGWTSGAGGDCYTGTPSLGTGSLLGVSIGAAQGYATGDDQGYIAAAHVADPTLTVLGTGLGDLGIVDSTASCALTTASCNATQTLTASTSLLGGRLTLSAANGSFLAKVDGATIPGGGSNLAVAPGLVANVKADGNFATIAIGLSTTQLLTALGLPTLLSALGTTLGTLTDTSGPSAATLTVKIGPGSVTSSPASAWGLNVSVDLSVDLKLGVGVSLITGPVNLATVEVATVPTSTPNLATLKLAYSTATAGLLLPGWVPSALI